ncbi:MAG: hypothetical protein WDM90_10875 [Ferruginibacter sp.]
MESQPGKAEKTPESQIAELEDAMTYKVQASFGEQTPRTVAFQGRGEAIKKEVTEKIEAFGPLVKILSLETW